MSKRYSSVTKGANGKGTFYQVHNANGNNYTESVTGYYVGGFFNPCTAKYKTTQLTIHLLQGDGNIVGVNLTGGLSSKIVELFKAGEPHVLFGSLGQFLSISTGETIEGKRGDFTIVDFEQLTPTFDMPKDAEASLDLVYWHTASEGRKPLGKEFKPNQNLVGENVEQTDDVVETTDDAETSTDTTTPTEGNFGTVFGK